MTTAPTTSSRPRPDNTVIVIFGITGDLARRKILPGLYHLAVAGLLPERYRIIGCARPTHIMTNDEFRLYTYNAITEFASDSPTGPDWDHFSEQLSYAVDPDDGPHGLVAVVGDAERAIGGAVRRVFHLAVPPDAMHDVIAQLGHDRAQPERPHHL